MMTEIREVNGKKYRFASLSEGHETYNKCSCCIFTGRCPSVIDCSDGFFIEEVKEEPPTKEQLKKIFNISKRCPMGDVEEDGEYHSYLGFDGFCEYIIKHWDDE